MSWPCICWKWCCSLQAKVAIRELLPNGLRESISKVRSSVAYAVSAIAHWDWPEAWPELFNLLMEMLVSGDVNAVHGAMRVLTGVWAPGLGRAAGRSSWGFSLCQCSAAFRPNWGNWNSLPLCSWAWCLSLAVESCARQVSWELGKEVLCCSSELSRDFDFNTLFSRYLQFLVWCFSACPWGLPWVDQMPQV